MTRKLDLSRYGGMSGTKLTVDDLEADNVVLTISEVGEEKNPDGYTPVLRFKEAPEKKLYVNRTQLEYVVRRYGDDLDSWVGKRVPLEKKVVPFENDRFPKVYVMPPDMWDTAFRQWDDYKRQSQQQQESGSSRRSATKR
jgi:hypothetical protein